MGRPGASAYRSQESWRRFSVVRAVLVAIGCALAISVVSQVFAQTDDQTPSGMVAFFMTSGSGCPAGWTAAAQGRLLLGVTDPTGIGKTVGTPMAAQTPPVHLHPFTTTITTLDRDLMADASCCNNDGAKWGSFTVPNNAPGTTNSGNGDASGLPFIQLVACRKN